MAVPGQPKCLEGSRYLPHFLRGLKPCPGLPNAVYGLFQVYPAGRIFFPVIKHLERRLIIHSDK